MSPSQDPTPQSWWPKPGERWEISYAPGQPQIRTIACVRDGEVRYEGGGWDWLFCFDPEEERCIAKPATTELLPLKIGSRTWAQAKWEAGEFLDFKDANLWWPCSHPSTLDPSIQTFRLAQVRPTPVVTVGSFEWAVLMVLQGYEVSSDTSYRHNATSILRATPEQRLEMWSIDSGHAVRQDPT